MPITRRVLLALISAPLFFNSLNKGPQKPLAFNDKTFQLEITGNQNQIPKNILDALKKYNEEVLRKRKLAIGPRDDREVEPPLNSSDSVEIISEDEELIKLGFVYVLKASELDTKGGNVYRNMFLRKYKETTDGKEVVKDGIYVKGLYKSKVIPINVPVIVLGEKTVYFVDCEGAWKCHALFEVRTCTKR